MAGWMIVSILYCIYWRDLLLKATVTMAVRTLLADLSIHTDILDSGSVPNLAPYSDVTGRGDSRISATTIGWT